MVLQGAIIRADELNGQMTRYYQFIKTLEAVLCSMNPNFSPYTALYEHEFTVTRDDFVCDVREYPRFIRYLLGYLSDIPSMIHPFRIPIDWNSELDFRIDIIATQLEDYCDIIRSIESEILSVDPEYISGITDEE